MAEPQPTRETVGAQIAQARAELSALRDALSEAQLQRLQVTERWDGVDMLRHIWAWHDYILRCLDDWNGPRDWAGPRPTGDAYNPYNEAMTSAWAALGRDELIARIFGAYDRYEAVLEALTDERMAETGLGPWGRVITYLDAAGVVEHDLEHFEHIRAAAL